MSKILCIKYKYAPLRKAKISITDEDDKVQYEVTIEGLTITPIIYPTLRINNNEMEVATLKKKILPWPPSWSVSSSMGNFAIKCKSSLFATNRTYSIIGGPFDRAMAKEKTMDSVFEIIHAGERLAIASGKVSLGDRHRIEIIHDDKKAELLTAILMVVFLEDRSTAD